MWTKVFITPYFVHFFYKYKRISPSGTTVKMTNRCKDNNQMELGFGAFCHLGVGTWFSNLDGFKSIYPL